MLSHISNVNLKKKTYGHAEQKNTDIISQI